MKIISRLILILAISMLAISMAISSSTEMKSSSNEFIPSLLKETVDCWDDCRRPGGEIITVACKPNANGVEFACKAVLDAYFVDFLTTCERDILP